MRLLSSPASSDYHSASGLHWSDAGEIIAFGLSLHRFREDGAKIYGLIHSGTLAVCRFTPRISSVLDMLRWRLLQPAFSTMSALCCVVRNTWYAGRNRLRLQNSRWRYQADFFLSRVRLGIG
jgi:hypothetical protein